MIKIRSSLKKKKFKIKLRNRFKDFLKKNSISSDTYNQVLRQGILKENLKYMITVKITPNNIFCTLKNLKKTLVVLTAGILKIKLTKRKLKFVSTILIKKFIKNLKKIKSKKILMLTISGPIKIRKKIIKQFINKLTRSKLIINVKNKKSFNGCRPKKARKRKRKGFRVRG